MRRLLKVIKNPSLPFTDVTNRVRAARIRLNPKDSESARIANWRFGSLPRIAANAVFPDISDIDVNVLQGWYRTEGAAMDVYELVLMSAIAKVTGAKRILEIGTYEGNTALNLAANTPADALIVTVDLPLNWDGQLAIMVPQSCVNVFERSNVGRQFHGSQFEAKIRQVLSDSKTMNWGELPGPFDMVFVDGCHYFDYVKSDTANSLRVLRLGGIIVWHDYGAYQDVSRVVDETAKTISVKALRGTRLAVGFKPS